MRGGSSGERPREPSRLGIPNLLTALRLVLVPVFAWLVIRDDYWWALAVFVTAGLTDGLDGYLARRLDQRTVLGAILDPLADKTLLVTAYLLLSLHTERAGIPTWLLAVVVIRESGIVLLSLGFAVRGGRREFAPSRWGKAATVSQVLLVSVCLTDNARQAESALLSPLIAMAAATTLVSAGQYLLRAVQWARLHGHAAGPEPRAEDGSGPSPPAP